VVLEGENSDKLILAFVSAAVLSAGDGISARMNLNMMKKNTEEMYGNDLISIRDLSAALFSYHNYRPLVRDISMAQTPVEEDIGIREDCLVGMLNLVEVLG
jgi:methyl-accepting chemotaxis protein